MADFNARINLEVDARAAKRQSQQFLNELRAKIKSADIGVKVKAEGASQAEKVINNLVRASAVLKSNLNSFSRGQKRDDFGVLATNADNFFRSVEKGNSFFSKTTAGLREQAAAAQLFADNISTADAKFKRFIAGAEGARPRRRRRARSYGTS